MTLVVALGVAVFRVIAHERRLGGDAGTEQLIRQGGVIEGGSPDGDAFRGLVAHQSGVGGAVLEADPLGLGVSMQQIEDVVAPLLGDRLAGQQQLDVHREQIGRGVVEEILDQWWISGEDDVVVEGAELGEGGHGDVEIDRRGGDADSVTAVVELAHAGHRVRAADPGTHRKTVDQQRGSRLRGEGVGEDPVVHRGTLLEGERSTPELVGTPLEEPDVDDHIIASVIRPSQ